MRGERIQVRKFEEVRSLLKSEKDPVVKQKLSFLVVAGEDCLYLLLTIAKMSSLRLDWSDRVCMKKSIKKTFSRVF
ncbi:MAG: hypothetical protein ACXQTA_00625 [Candidatus Syntropharchaeales archaeon]